MVNEKRLIDANAIQAKLEKMFRKLVANQKDVELAAAISYVDDLIGEAPTVDAVEVVHGRWEKVKRDLGDGIKTYRFGCSECGYLKNTLTGNYCPNCGADMRERNLEDEN